MWRARGAATTFGLGLTLASLGLLCFAGACTSGGDGAGAGAISAQQEPPLGHLKEYLRVCAAAGTVPGIDVSRWQGSIDWAQVKGAGIQWAYAKATQDTTIVDSSFATNWAGMKQAGVTRGAYHFFHPGVDGGAQADHYLATVGTLGPGDLPPMLDWEKTFGISPAVGMVNAQAFIDRVLVRTGLPTVIYTSPGLWPGLSTQDFSQNQLWVAYWTYDAVNACPSLPANWSDWVFWQYSDKGTIPGITANVVDLDVFNGDLATLAGLSGDACNGPIGHPIGGGGLLSGPCGGAAPPVSPPQGCGSLGTGKGLQVGQSLGSCDGRFSMFMQSDGNLVLYSHGNALWSAGSASSGATTLTLQSDGNLVLYTAGGCPVWASNSSGHPGARLALQDDGNLVIYDGGTPVWSSGSGPLGLAPSNCGGLSAGHGLALGETLNACGGCFSLKLQGDGNLVLSQSGVGTVWSSGTNSTKPGYALTMKNDGELVIDSRGGCPVWSSNSGGHPGATFAVQDDGNLVVYAPGGVALWNSGTSLCSGACTCGTPPPVDGGTPDAGGGTPDAGGGTPDAGGGTMDGGGSDSGNSGADADAGGGGGGVVAGGCGCSSGRGPADRGLALALGLGLIWLDRRRRCAFRKGA